MENQDRIQAAIDIAKAQVEKAEALERLWKNNDFQKLIVKGFMTEDAAFAVRNSISHTFQPETRQAFLSMAQAAGWLSEHFEAIRRGKDSALTTIKDNTEFLLSVQHDEAGSN